MGTDGVPQGFNTVANVIGDPENKGTEEPAPYIKINDPEFMEKYSEAVKNDPLGMFILDKEHEAENPVGFTESFKLGWGTSPFGVDNRLTRGENVYKPTTGEEWNEIQKLAQNDVDRAHRLMLGATSMEDVKNNAKVFEEAQKDHARLMSAPWYWGLTGGFANMSGNPVDIVGTAAGLVTGGSATAVTASSKLAKTGRVLMDGAIGVGLGVGSNQYQEYITGINHDVWSDVFAMTAIYGGLRGAMGGLSKGRDVVGAVAANHDTLLKGGTLGEGAIAKFSNFTFPSYKKMMDMREQIVSKLPSVEIKSKLLEYRKATENPELKEFIDNLTDWEQGIRSAEGKSYMVHERPNEAVQPEKGVFNPNPPETTTLKGSGKTTFMEEVEGFRVQDRRLMDSIRNDLSDLGHVYDRELLNRYLSKALQGRTNFTSLEKEMMKDEKLNRIVKDIRDYLDKRKNALNQHGLIEGGYGWDNYLPLVIDRYKVARLASGTTEEQLAKDLNTTLYNGVIYDAGTTQKFLEIYRNERDSLIQKLKDEAVNDLKAKAKYDELVANNKKMTAADEFADFTKWLDKEAKGASMGYRDQNTSRPGAENFNNNAARLGWRKRRLPWNTAYKDPNTGIAIDDLRMDIVDMLDRYSKRTSGELASMRVYGKGFDELMDHIDKLANDYHINTTHRTPNTKTEFIQNASAVIRRGYGMAISDADYSNADALTAVARNLTYGAYSTLMGVLNYGEVAGAIRAYGLQFFFKTLPGVHELFNKFTRTDLSKGDIAIMKNYFVGQDVAKRLNVREIIRSNKELYRDANPYLAKVVGLSQVFADYSPGSFLMNYSNQTILDTAQSAFFTEAITRAHGGKQTKRGFMRDIDRKRLAITQKDQDYFMRVLKKNTVMDKDGSISLREGFETLADDDYFSSILRRYVDYVSNETIQRRGLDDLFSWQVGKGHPLIGLAMQFKSFALQSYNKRFVKLLNRVEDEGALASISEFMISGALTAAVTFSQIQLRALGMPEDVKDRYLKKTLGFSDIGDLSLSDLSQVMFNVLLNRHPHLASFALMLNTAGIGTDVKTTAATKMDFDPEDESKSWFIPSSDVMGNILDMMPFTRVFNNIGHGSIGLYNLAQNAILDEDDYRQRTQTIRQLMKGIGALPNVPYLTNSLKSWLNDKREDYASPYGVY